MILLSLFLSDEHFKELLEKREPNLCSRELQEQLLATGIAEIHEEITGDEIVIKPQFTAFLADKNAVELRKLCEGILLSEQSMHWFFEDIRDRERRERMAKCFLDLLNKGKKSFVEGLKRNLNEDAFLRIEHTRCWLADLMPVAVGESHNSFNRRMFQSALYHQSLGNPFNNLTIKSPRLGNDATTLEEYTKVAFESFEIACSEKNIMPTGMKPETLEKALLMLRVDAAIKLQKFNPLYAILERVARDLNLYIQYQGTQSVLSDLSDPRDPVGKYDLFHITDGRKTLLVNAVAVHDRNGDHKSKEWGARRRATLYRYVNEEIVSSEFQEGVFVIDGEWHQKDINRLHNSGWNRIIRLAEIENTFEELFKPKISKIQPLKRLPEIPDDYYMLEAAENSKTQKIKARKKRKKSKPSN